MTGPLEGIQPPTPEDFHRAIAELHHREMGEQVGARRRVVSMGAIVCSCRPWFDWAAQVPPQHGCAVHGGVMVTIDGSEVL